MAHLVLAVTVLVWSFSFLAAARLRQELSVAESLAARFLPVLIGAGAMILARRPLRIPRQAWPVIISMGLLGVPLYNLFFFIGLKTVPSGTASLVIALNPVLTVLLAWLFLREPFGRRQRLGLVLSLLGVFVVVRYGTERAVDWPYLSSALLLSLAPLSWAAYTVVGRIMPRGTHTLDACLALLFVGSLPLIALAGPGLAQKLATSPGALLAALYLALPCTLFGFTAWLWALRRLPAGEVAAFVFLNPPLANLWAWLFEGARLRAPFLAGAAVLLLGVAVITLPSLGRAAAEGRRP